jgi:molybdenum cofactor biosynthesis enzyme MoaA
MHKFNIEAQYLYKLISMPRGANSLVPLTNICNIPMYTISVDYLGNCFLCDCDGWLPIPVGQVTDFNSIEEVLSSTTAKILQNDVKNNNFTWCAIDHCGIRSNSRVKQHVSLSINIDESCNLQCPSCRRDSIMITSGPEHDYRLQNANIILEWLTKYNQPIHINMSGNGDPLASTIMRPIIKNFQPKEDQTFTLQTNGLLIKKQINEGMAIANSITNFSISVDAGTKEVYEDVRRPGKWDILLENFEYLTSVNKQHLVNLNFVIQNKNYHTIPDFIKLCQHYGFRGYLTQLDDWGTWSQVNPGNQKDTWTIKNGIFSDQNVLDSTHPNYKKCKQLIVQYCNLKDINFSPQILNQINYAG